MSVALTYGQIRHPDFTEAIKKIAKCSDYKNVALMLRIYAAYKVIVEAEKSCMDVQNKLLEQHGTKQEGRAYKIINQEAFDADTKALMETEFCIEGDGFKFNDLVPAKLCPADLVALGHLVIT